MREVIELTKELIRFPSMHSRPEEIRRCADFIAGYLEHRGIQAQRCNHEGIPSILVLPETGYAPVLLMSHIDVVDAPEGLFQPEERDGRLYGRGSNDDKYAAALSLVLLSEHMSRLAGSGKGQAQLPFGVLITGDEEIGGINGAKRVLRDLRTDFCIALDGGSLNEIIMKEKGLAKVRLVARGQSAHGSRPWMGDNAIEKLFQDYQALKPLFADAAPDHWHKTLNLGKFHAGKSTNQVPDQAEAWLDIRYTEQDDIDELLAKIDAATASEMIVEEKEPLFFGSRSAHLDRLLEVAPDARLGLAHGASDARHLSAYGMGGIVWGATGNNTQHSLDEHVEVESVLALYRILDTFLTPAG